MLAGKRRRGSRTMAAKSFYRGHSIRFDTALEVWVYSDSGEVTDYERPCAKCGELAEKGGPDPCLGLLEGVSSACCGHGVENPYKVFYNDNEGNENVRRKPY